MDMTMDFSGEVLMEFFVSMLIIGIGVALLATGIFTSYFGAGKSQKIGFALLFFGIITLTLVYLMTFGGVDAIPNQFNETTFMDSSGNSSPKNFMFFVSANLLLV